MQCHPELSYYHFCRGADVHDAHINALRFTHSLRCDSEATAQHNCICKPRCEIIDTCRTHGVVVFVCANSDISSWLPVITPSIVANALRTAVVALERSNDAVVLSEPSMSCLHVCVLV